ncbi:MAG: hypothetical protein IKU20_04425 [Lachnospiraceae bacterium]|nr:hypothetical protein [Lachnospiraceae bacterium]
MSAYFPVIGIISNIEYIGGNETNSATCTLLFTIDGESPAGVFQVQLPANAYVLNLHPFQLGDRVTFFYDPNAPMVLIYPPRYTAVAGAYTPHGTSAMLDQFHDDLTTSDRSLKLNLAQNTPITLPNGQPFKGSLEHRLLLVFYGMTTRSIPPQTTPEQVIVFCQDQ